MHVAYKRVLLKLSGEVFGGGEVGLDLDVINTLAGEVAEVAKSGVQIAIVVGGGNFFRGAELQQRGMERARADYMGMLGTTEEVATAHDDRDLHTRLRHLGHLGGEGVDDVEVQPHLSSTEHFTGELEQDSLVRHVHPFTAKLGGSSETYRTGRGPTNPLGARRRTSGA